MDDATRSYLVKLGNPYAKLSIVDQEELPLISAEQPRRIDLVWKKRTEVYNYIGETFSLPIVRNRPSPLLKQLGEKLVRLSPRAQNEFHRRIAAYLPDERIVYNRLPPNQLDQLFARLLEVAEAVSAMDGQADH